MSLTRIIVAPYTQLETRKLQQVCWHLVTELLQQDGNVLCSNISRQLDDAKSVASCQQTCCKLIVKTSYPRQFRQIATSLQSGSLISSHSLQLDEIDKFFATLRSKRVKSQLACDAV